MQINRKSLHDPADEVLESIWVLQEKGERTDTAGIMSRDHDGILTPERIEELVSGGLLKKEGDIYDFTEAGRERGKGVIRRHRLAERLLVDVLSIKEDNFIESGACRFEHVLSPEVTDHICILLGHPRKCPHGNDIPPGACCESSKRQVDSAIVPLSRLGAGERGRVLYISTSRHDRLDRLTSLGLFPGRHVKVHQREPLFVIFIGETQLALEKGIVEEIYVVKS